MDENPEMLSFVKGTGLRRSFADHWRIGPREGDPARTLPNSCTSPSGMCSTTWHSWSKWVWSTKLTVTTTWMRRAIESYARVQFEGKRPTFEANAEKPEDVRKVLKNYLNADGTLKQIPPQGNKLLIVLNFIVDAFAYDTNYTEKEVNTILRRFHVDTAALRRYLVDNGLMARESDGTRYWRVKNERE